MQQKSSKREVSSDTGIPQETRKISYKQPNLPSKVFKKTEEQTEPKVSRRKEIIKIKRK